MDRTCKALNRYAISKSEEETNERKTYALFDDFQFYRSNKQLASTLSPVLSQQHVYTSDASLMRPILLRSLLSLDTQRSEGREENTDHEQTASNDDEGGRVLCSFCPGRELHQAYNQHHSAQQQWSDHHVQRIDLWRKKFWSIYYSRFYRL